MTAEQRRLAGEKLFDLANFAGAALVFGQFVGQPPVSMRILVGGIAIWMLLATVAYRLTGGRE